MTVRIPKYLYYVLISLLLLSFILLIIVKVDHFSLSFSITNNAYTANIAIHESDDGNQYVFLPSYAKLEELEILLSPGTDASLGGIPIFDGMLCSDFQLNTSYDLVLDGQYIAPLQFCQSQNVRTIYIDTTSGSMERVHEKLGAYENAVVTVFSSNGICEHIDYVASIKGRGNATWGYEKKPYSLTLSERADLAGMGAATNWILLANATDETNLNNKLIMDLAQCTGLGWTPECAYVDVYLNGTYNGLYLLTEKVEVGNSRLNLNTNAGDFLCKVDLESRMFKLDNPFKTNGGRTIEISSPEGMTVDREAAIQKAVNQLETLILSNADLRNAPNFDLDSWAKRYLLDEISGNIDSDLASSYFYCSDGVFYAGPVWDYDMALGNHMRNQEPNAFTAKNKFKGATFGSTWYNSLYENPVFYKHVVQLYQTSFLPVLQQLIASDIPRLTLELQPAANMNSIRWRSMFVYLQAQNPNTVHTIDGLVDYLEKKIDFLSQVWLNNAEVCTLQFECIQDDGYWNISVAKNSILETSYLDLENTTWINTQTGKTVDFSQPIVSDMILTQQFEESQVQPAYEDYEEVDLAYYITYLSISMLLLLLLGFLTIDFCYRRKERSAARASQQRYISP